MKTMNINSNAKTLKTSTLSTSLKALACLVILLGLSSCKLEIDASGSGSGNVQTVSGTIDCDYDGSSTSNDCAQEYVNDITECDNHESTPDPTDSDEWSELPECTEVGMAEDITECSNYDANDPAKDEWHELYPVCIPAVTENFVATPDENSTFGGWHENCAGAGSCGYTVDGDDVDNETVYTVEAKFEPEATPEDVSYTYNHLGQRKSKTVGTSPNQITTYYIYGPGGELLVEQTDESPDPLIKTYIYMDGELTAIHEKQGTSENLHYVINNRLGQPMYMISQNNALHFERYQEPFGKTYSQYQVNAISDHNTRFPGQTYEVETGYHYNWHRDYDPETGRYLQPDPLGLYDGPNTYAYVQGNPVNYYDYMGLATQLGGGVSGAVAVPGLGMSGSLQLGISFPDDLTDWKCYQFFGAGNVNSVLGGGAFFGGGLTGSYSDNDSVNTGLVVRSVAEAAAGWGPSAGFSGTGSNEIDANSWSDYFRQLFDFDQDIDSLSLSGFAGGGYGGYAGVGQSLIFTLATDSCDECGE